MPRCLKAVIGQYPVATVASTPPAITNNKTFSGVGGAQSAAALTAIAIPTRGPYSFVATFCSICMLRLTLLQADADACSSPRGLLERRQRALIGD